MKSVMMKWVRVDYSEGGFWIRVSVVVSHELSLRCRGVLAAIYKGVSKSIPPRKLAARFSKLFQRFCVCFQRNVL